MPKTLLVADDSLTIRKVIGMIFATEDFQVTAVDNGLDAISRSRELRPDVILADVMMPGKNGYEVCEALKHDPATQHIPVMLLAGTFEAFDEARARAARADDTQLARVGCRPARAHHRRRLPALARLQRADFEQRRIAGNNRVIRLRGRSDCLQTDIVNSCSS